MRHPVKCAASLGRYTQVCTGLHNPTVKQLRMVE